MLTDAQVRKIKPAEKKTKYSDEKGMYLEVTPSGGMHWRMKFRFNGKENIFSIGTYPDTTLAQARRIRDEARLNLKDGINPNEAKKQKNCRSMKVRFSEHLQWNGCKTVKQLLKKQLTYVIYRYLKKTFPCSR
jgi:hypothetical protein